MIGLDGLRALTAGKVGIADVACPLCGPKARAGANQRRKVLRIWDDGEFVTYKCARCDESGWAKDRSANSTTRPAQPKAETSPRQTANRCCPLGASKANRGDAGGSLPAK